MKLDSETNFSLSRIAFGCFVGGGGRLDGGQFAGHFFKLMLLVAALKNLIGTTYATHYSPLQRGGVVA